MQCPGFGAQATVVHWQVHVRKRKSSAISNINTWFCRSFFNISKFYTTHSTFRMLNPGRQVSSAPAARRGTLGLRLGAHPPAVCRLPAPYVTHWQHTAAVHGVHAYVPPFRVLLAKKRGLAEGRGGWWPLHKHRAGKEGRNSAGE